MCKELAEIIDTLILGSPGRPAVRDERTGTARSHSARCGLSNNNAVLAVARMVVVAVGSQAP